MQNLDQILGDKQFWRFEVRGRACRGTRWSERQRQIIQTGNYGRWELYLAVNDFLAEISEGNEHVELYVVMTDGDPALVGLGHWERLIAFPNPDSDGGWETIATEVQTMAEDVEQLFA